MGKKLSQITSAKANGGPLGQHISLFADRLRQQGYSNTTLKSKIVILKRFSMWLGCQGQTLTNIDKQTVIAFFKEHPRPGYVRRGELACLLNLLKYLHEIGVLSTPSEKTTSVLQCLVESFSRYLKYERRLSESTIITYTRIASLFLSQNSDNQTEVDLSCQKVTEFICQSARLKAPRYTLITSALRSLLRYLYLSGKTPTDFSPSVPTVAEWKLSPLPKFLGAEQVEAILAATDHSSEVGLRDHAILLFLARLGLRACEIKNMQLEDIHWELGQLTVRGKGGQQDCLPLQQDVGEALANYLLNGRPRCATRRVFIRAKAPRQGFATSTAVCNVVQRALARAGINIARKGAHLLRHSLAVRMLDGGATLNEIAEVLRHCSPITTEIYMKVDLESLVSLAQPWPGGDV